MKSKITMLMPYLIVLVINFYILPAMIKNTGIAIFMMLCVIPLISFVCALIYGIRNGFSYTFLIIAILLFVPTIFIYYNSTAWIYIVIYGIILLAGNGIGRIFYKDDKRV